MVVQEAMAMVQEAMEEESAWEVEWALEASPLPLVVEDSAWEVEEEAA